MNTMQRRAIMVGAVSVVTGAVSSFAGPSSSAIRSQNPPGWAVRFSFDSAGYNVGIDSMVAHGGRRSAYIQFRGLEPQGWATVMQTFRADEYRGKRVRLSAFVKTENVESGALLWMRVEGPDDSVLASDNMGNRPIRGTTDWRSYDVVLEIPKRAQAIAIGFLLDRGWGRVWVDDVTVSLVGTDVAPTAPLGPARARGRGVTVTPTGDRPLNLDFER